MKNELDSFERDMLLEAASIAAGKTIKAIQSIIGGQPVSISVPTLELAGIEHIADTMGKPQDVKTVVCTPIMGEAHGDVVLLVDPTLANQLLATVDEKLRISALEEMTNVIAGAALGSLTKLLNMLFLQAVPVSTTDMLRAVMNQVVSELGGETARVLSLMVPVTVGTANVPMSLYLLFDTATTNTILEAGKKLAESEADGTAH